MKLYLAGVINKMPSLKAHGITKGLYNLSTYAETVKMKSDTWREFLDFSESVLVDSGAHGFQRGIKVEWDKFTDDYAEWILRNDDERVQGYFEMDIDNIVGKEKVLQFRQRLREASDKIIPVWHKSWGFGEFEQLCEEYRGQKVSVSGFKNEDIRDADFPLFVRAAHDHGAYIHGLGIGRESIISKVRFDSVDTSSWLTIALRGTFKTFPTGKYARFLGKDRDSYVVSFRHWLNWQKYWEAVTSGR